MTLNAQILLQLLATESSSSDLSTTVRTTNVQRSLTFTNGTGANQAQIVWSDSRTIASLADDQLFLESLEDARGTVSFSAVKAVYIRNTGTATVAISGNATEPWGSGPFDLPEEARIFVAPGGILLLTNASAEGWLVNDEFDQLTLTSELNATYDIIMIGEGSIT